MPLDDDKSDQDIFKSEYLELLYHLQHAIETEEVEVEGNKYSMDDFCYKPITGEGCLVTSPMVGTAYYASSPGAEPFVKVGDSVTKGQTVLIVEAMKTMNQIPAPVSGTVQEIVVSNGQPVEYGEPLLRIV